MINSLDYSDTSTAATVVASGHMDSYTIMTPSATEAIKEKLEEDYRHS
ncbi:MAG TPA: hypothetical protein VGP47_01535 [Parachlamydiaceae bacterium]|nr:hypothetical protein [Nitrosopumilus sp.]HEV8051147.1 hypothetical protein [Parachlamydiaceae bacterium]